MTSMYETLGIARNASSAEIKRAYRKRAMSHHPDRPGGSDVAFVPVQQAYDVLMDADKRDHYDRTGEVLQPTDEEKEILSRLAQLFSVILDQPNVPGDAVLKASSMVADSINKLETNIADATARSAQLERKRKRIVNTKGTANVYASVVNERSAQLAREIEHMHGELKLLHGVRRALGDYEDKDPGSPYTIRTGAL